jgi:hypothetical protein
MMYESTVSGFPFVFLPILINKLHLLLDATDANKLVFVMLILIKVL